MKTEQELIRLRYENRKSNSRVSKHSKNSSFKYWIQKEREKEYRKILKTEFDDLASIKVLEIGAGAGGHIQFFQSLGIPLNNIHVNELLEDRVELIKENFPDVKIFEGDALNIPEANNKKYDLIFQSTVFTSILDDGLKKSIANKMDELLTENGIILWYDFVYDNPKNPDVKGVSKKEVGELFNSYEFISKKKVTLAPPIGRRVKGLYPLINIPPLRTHLVAALKKKS